MTETSPFPNVSPEGGVLFVFFIPLSFFCVVLILFMSVYFKVLHLVLGLDEGVLRGLYISSYRIGLLFRSLRLGIDVPRIGVVSKSTSLLSYPRTEVP